MKVSKVDLVDRELPPSTVKTPDGGPAVETGPPVVETGPPPSNESNEPNEPNPRRWLIFGVISAALLMAAVDQTIVSTALPAIQRDLHAQVNWSGWTITIYALGQVLVMPVAGRLADQYGRKRIFISAVALFTLASVACGLANDIYVLVGLRALQSIGGGAFIPSATAIVADQFGRDRDRAVGLFASVYPIGGIAGPILGGFFVQYWSWRGIFLVNVPIGITLFVLALKFVPYTSPTEARGHLDRRGIGLLGLLILLAMFGFAWLGRGDISWYDPVFLTAEFAAIGVGYLFVRHCRNDPASFIPYEMLRGRGFAVMNVMNTLFGAAVFGFGALIPLYAEQRYGLDPLRAGTLLSGRSIGMISVAGLAVLALRRTGYRWPIAIGFLVTAAGSILIAIDAPTSPYTWLAVSGAIVGVGVGLTVPASNNASLQLAPDRIASITGLRGMFRQGGGILAVSLSTAVVARAHDGGVTFSYVFVALAVGLIIAAPFAALIPEHRGSW